GRHDVVDHDRGDALVLVVGVPGFAGQGVGLVGGQGGFRGGRGFRRGGAGRGVLALFAGGQRHAERQNGQNDQQFPFHSQFLFSCLFRPQGLLPMLISSIVAVCRRFVKTSARRRQNFTILSVLWDRDEGIIGSG